MGVTRRGGRGGRLGIRSTLARSRTFLIGGGGTVVNTIMTMVMVMTNTVLCGGFCTRPHRRGTRTTLFGDRRCFRRDTCRRTLGNSDVNSVNFLGMTSRFDNAGTTGLTGTCTNVYCRGLNGCRRTVGTLSNFDKSSRVMTPTVRNTVNGYCTRLNRLSGTASTLLGTTSRTSGDALDPVFLLRTKRVLVGRNGGRRTMGTFAGVGSGCFRSCRTVSVSGCVRRTGLLGGWWQNVCLVV